MAATALATTPIPSVTPPSTTVKPATATATAVPAQRSEAQPSATDHTPASSRVSSKTKLQLVIEK